MKRFILLLLVVLAILPTVSADYYGDIVFEVNRQGETTMTGISNYPLFALGKTSQLVTYEDGYYLFNLTFSEAVFSDFVYELHLPKGASITYLHTPEFNRVEHRPDGLVIIGSAEDQPLNIIVQYSVPTRNLWLLIIGVLLVVGLVTYWFATRKPAPRKEIVAGVKQVKELPKGLTPRQEKIYKLLQQHGPLTQSRLEELTGFPKSSLSRNIDVLVRKELIEKHDHGMTNKLYLK